MRRINVKAGLLVFVGVTSFGCSAGGQGVRPGSVARADLACRASPSRVGTRDWVRRMQSALKPENQDKLPVGRLVGFLVEPSGAPIENVIVSLSQGSRPPGDTARRRVARTDAAGAFSLDSIENRDYILYVLNIGMESQWRAYRGVRGITDTLCMEMRAAPLYFEPVYTGRAKI